MSCNAGGGQHDTSILQMLLVYLSSLRISYFSLPFF